EDFAACCSSACTSYLPSFDVPAGLAFLNTSPLRSTPCPFPSHLPSSPSFGMWYGKGPGVDRCGDVFKHANSAGTSKNGGVLVLAGDDHAAKSSTLPHQSEHIFKACLIPVLNPSSVQDYLDLGLHGYAMSRFSGCWLAFKCVTDVVESGASVVVDPQRVLAKIPEFALPAGGLNIRWPDGILEQEARILDYKV